MFFWWRNSHKRTGMVTFLKNKKKRSSLLSPPSGTLEPHLSALLWIAMLVSLAIVIVLPQPHGIRALIASTILRLIFSVGLEPTLFLLGAFNVSVFPKSFQHFYRPCAPCEMGLTD